ncbi:DedA family protein [Chitinasiproducens palmae]|uniref:Membrane-associated protein n=1 Tax=Chitinasiproducens palmae TaxID=1770053 RepID=A0A1H2PSB5_9BURK|nr:DedA family protein [Chitinasiproducens palmae]SDV49446.1 membrane-associated protein [Chitinasiproducens palmae]
MLLQLIDMTLHIDKHLAAFIALYGNWIYAILFLIVFCETGLVVFPFLPGDSLLFIAGAFAGAGAMSLPTLIVLLFLAAVLGNTVNYLIGSYIGPKVFEKNWRFLDRDALRRTHQFYERHGGKTIVLARFVPVVRTFAPFIAGVSGMSMWRFQLFNIVGALLWAVGLTLCGYFFGNLSFVKEYLNVIVLVGLCAAIVPIVLGALWKLFRKRPAAK